MFCFWALPLPLLHTPVSEPSTWSLLLPALMYARFSNAAMSYSPRRYENFGFGADVFAEAFETLGSVVKSYEWSEDRGPQCQLSALKNWVVQSTRQKHRRTTEYRWRLPFELKLRNGWQTATGRSKTAAGSKLLAEQMPWRSRGRQHFRLTMTFSIRKKVLPEDDPSKNCIIYIRYIIYI